MHPAQHIRQCQDIQTHTAGYLSIVSFAANSLPYGAEATNIVCCAMSKAKVTCNLQDAGAGGAHEGSHSHVGIGWAALVAVKALSVGRQTRHFSQHLQVFLLLFSLRTRRHG